MTFGQFFEKATGRRPYPYQERLADDWFDLVNAPTGAGKTAAAILAWLWRRRFADEATRSTTPRRLIYCLPMRVLVEQTHAEAVGWLNSLGMLARRTEQDDERSKRGPEPDEPDPGIAVHLLMGGEERTDWHLYPERDAILIGTQDMLLSRALNRGYAASRFHWPIDFGLLNNDCLWVFDEPQLMGSGVSTSAQLAGLRAALGTIGPCPSMWMSATLERCWLDTIDFRGKFPLKPLELGGDDYDDGRPLHKRMTAQKTLASLGITATKDGKEVAKEVLKRHEKGTQTLVVLNTVDRARSVYDTIQKTKGAPSDVLLIHSRFRPVERKALNNRLREQAGDRIIVATQVVEAGVDISARTLFTELAPWASLVQRIGRCNRTGEGEDGPGRVYWIDLDTEKQSKPYDADELKVARDYLTKLDGRDVSPKALADFKQDESIHLQFTPAHVLRRRDLLDLFDTAPDLSGNDIDIARFVRGDEEDVSVQVFWRPEPPDNRWDAAERRRQSARRVELCNVPIGSFKTEFLGAGKTAYRFDYLDGEWLIVGKRDRASVVPGQVFWVVADQGGYDPNYGWSPAAGRLPERLLIPLPNAAPMRRGQRPEGFYDSDEWCWSIWRSIADHTEDVIRELASILHRDNQLPLTDTFRRALALAARWHDWGKAHDVFQSGVAEAIENPRDKELPIGQRRSKSRPDGWKGCTVVAKAPDEFWQRYSRLVSPADLASDRAERRVRVKRFRHELASVLGILASERAGVRLPDWPQLGSSERLLALYLIAAHHGKVRLSVRTMPDEAPVPPDPLRQRFAAGIWDEDELPGADLGGGISSPPVILMLDTMLLGGIDSWSSGVLQLRESEDFGPFRLAYLEALLRAADCRASEAEEVEDDD